MFINYGVWQRLVPIRWTILDGILAAIIDEAAY